MAKKRERLEVIYDILNTVREHGDGVNPTRLQHKSNLSPQMFKEYTEELLEKKQEEKLRAIVDTVGKRNKPGQNLQNVISVAMLSEGWDAANVTHIMGLRAFTSQLLCEQVIGRGLRRVGYDVD